MKKIIIIHISLCLLVSLLFWGLGSIDKNRFEKASANHKPSLLFAHDKILIKDGGSIYWESLMYRATEQRRMRTWKEQGKTIVADGFQGTSWNWKYHNLIWIWLIIVGSLISSIFTRRQR